MDRHGCWSIPRGVCSQWPNLNLIFPSYLERWLQMVLPISEGALAYLEIAQQNEHLFFIGCFSLCKDTMYTRILYLYMLCYHRALCLCAPVVSTDSLVSGAITMTVQNYCSTVTTNFPKQESLYQTEDGQNCTKLDKTCLAELRLSHCPYVTLTDLSRRNCWSLEVSWHLLPVWPPLQSESLPRRLQSLESASLSSHLACPKQDIETECEHDIPPPSSPQLSAINLQTLPSKYLNKPWTRPARFNQCLGFSCFNHWIPIQWQLPQVWYRAKRPKSLALDAENRKDKASLVQTCSRLMGNNVVVRCKNSLKLRHLENMTQQHNSDSKRTKSATTLSWSWRKITLASKIGAVYLLVNAYSKYMSPCQCECSCHDSF